MDKIIWAPKAVMDLETTCDYLAQDSIEFASIFAKRVLDLIEPIPSFPYSGRIVPELHNDFIREKSFKVIESFIELIMNR